MTATEYTTETRMLPDVKNIDVLMKQKTVTTTTGLAIESWFVRDQGSDEPYVVQVIGSDADLTPGASYTVMLRERKQTRTSDGAVFTEIQIAGAQPA